MTENFSLLARLKSFRAAGHGFIILLRDEHNARVHLVVTLLVIIGAIALDATRHDWIVLMFAIALVWLAEALNTAVENLADRVTLQRDPLIAKAKDVACFAVLVASLFAATAGLLVFIPLLRAL